MFSTLARLTDRRRAASCLAALLATSGYVHAAPPPKTSSWNVAGSGSWSVNSNWLGGTPVSGSAVSIVASDNFSRTVTYDYGGPSILFSTLQVDHAGNGTTLFAQHVGTFNASSEAIGDSANGSWYMDGGIHKTHGLVFGNQIGAVGTGKLQGGTVTTFTTDEAETIGAAGSGIFEHIDGGNLCGSFVVGGASTGVGTYIQSGGGVWSSSAYIGASGTGHYTQSGGTFTTTSEYVGYSGTGTVSVQGGTHNVTHNSYNGQGTMVLGYGPGSAGTFLLGGTGSLIDQNFVTVGYSGAGTFIQSGGTFVIGPEQGEEIIPGMIVGGASGGTGRYVLNAGTLGSGFIVVGGAGIGTFIQNGGSLGVATMSVSNNGTVQWNGGSLSAYALELSGGGKMFLSSGGGKVLRTTALTVDTPNGSKLDLADNAAIIDYSGASPLSTFAGYIQAGYANGAWTGNGITSSSAAAASSAHKTALGYAEASDLGVATFHGLPVDSTTVLVSYTLNGDANLDGAVNTIDFNLLAASFGQSGKRWFNGDFNYSGTVDSIDFNLLASNFSVSLMSMPAPADVAPLVPEPMALIWLLAMLPARRTRRCVAPA